MTSRHERLLKGTPSDPDARKQVQLNMLSSNAVTKAISYAARAATGVKTTALHRPVSSFASISSEWSFEVGDKYVNLDSKQRTVILDLRGRQAASTSLDTVLAALTANGIDSADVASIFKGEDQRQVQLTFASKPSADSLLSLKSLPLSPMVNAAVRPVRSDFHEIRVHWVPDYIHDALFKDIFSRFGKVASVVKTREKNGRTGSIRLVRIHADWKVVETIPHLMALRYEGQAIRLLITIKGRPPLCLLCDQIGHVKASCPRSPANVAAREAK